jgi:hypothetical protein
VIVVLADDRELPPDSALERSDLVDELFDEVPLARVV